MVKRLKKKLRGLEIEITFAEPGEYDAAGRLNISKKNRNSKERRGKSRKKRLKKHSF